MVKLKASDQSRATQLTLEAAERGWAYFDGLRTVSVPAGVPLPPAPPTALATRLCELEAASAGEAGDQKDGMLTYLAAQKTLLQGLTQLRNSLSLLERGAAMEVDQLISTVVPLLSAPALDEFSYLPNFLLHIKALAQSLGLSRSDDYFALLKRGPEELLAELIVRTKDVSRAEQVASRLGMSLPALVVCLLPALSEALTPEEFMAMLEKVAPQNPPLVAAASLLFLPLGSRHEVVQRVLSLALDSSQSRAGLHYWVRQKLALYAELYPLLTQLERPPVGPARAATSGSGISPISTKDMQSLVKLLREVDLPACQTRNEEMSRIVERLLQAGEFQRAVQIGNDHLHGAGTSRRSVSCSFAVSLCEFLLFYVSPSSRTSPLEYGMASFSALVSFFLGSVR
jgi:hypothetical protein